MDIKKSRNQKQKTTATTVRTPRTHQIYFISKENKINITYHELTSSKKLLHTDSKDD